MGYIRHNAIVATTWQEESADALVAYASEVGAEAVVGPEVTNGYRTVMIAPDGSKEGWQESDDGNERRRLIREWLDAGGDRGIYFEWIEVVYGDDDSAASIVDSAWGTPSPGAAGGGK